MKRPADTADEHAVLVRQLAAAQRRATQMIAENDDRIEQLIAENMRLRGALIARDTLVATLREEIALLEAAMPGPGGRAGQARLAEARLARIHQLERQLVRARQQRTAATALAPSPEAFRDKAVLCIDRRAGVARYYRRLVEGGGGRFLHHDDSDECDERRLEASLAAADLVICQAGCIGHGGYWRIRDHCRRTGKQCVLVDEAVAADAPPCPEAGPHDTARPVG